MTAFNSEAASSRTDDPLIAAPDACWRYTDGVQTTIVVLPLR